MTGRSGPGEAGPPGDEACRRRWQGNETDSANPRRGEPGRRSGRDAPTGAGGGPGSGLGHRAAGQRRPSGRAGDDCGPGPEPQGGQVQPVADGPDLHVQRVPDRHAGDQHLLDLRVVGRRQGRRGRKRTGSGSGGLSGLGSLFPSALPIFGPGQRDLPVSLTFASVPLYTGGRLLRNIDAADAQLGAQRSEEFRTAMDLKLTVAEAYVGVLRAQKDLEVARSNVEQLASFARDVQQPPRAGPGDPQRRAGGGGLAGQRPARRDPGADRAGDGAGRPITATSAGP